MQFMDPKTVVKLNILKVRQDVDYTRIYKLIMLLIVNLLIQKAKRIFYSI